MALQCPEATIDFLLTALDCSDGKVDWQQVAVQTGWYKSGKFSRQAFTSIKNKYGGQYVGSNGADKSTPKKRRVASSVPDKEGVVEKKARKAKDKPEEEAQEANEVKEEDGDE